jgi:site-specific DNA recombinase
MDVESGSSTAGREEYKRMMDDAEKGDIDLIITKSISRFGRDAKDIIADIHKLSAQGVYVFFEEQNLNSRSPESELIITLQGSIAQAENLSLSENIKWGIRRKIENGSSLIYDRPCYGYRADETAALVVVPEEAAIVRRIFAMYLYGMSILKIKAALELEGITSPTGKNIWSKRTIDMILSNKKYCGLSVVKSAKTSYEIENHHEPIITLDLFERTQTAKAERTNIEVGEDGKKLRRSTKFTSQKTPANK